MIDGRRSRAMWQSAVDWHSAVCGSWTAAGCIMQRDGAREQRALPDFAALSGESTRLQLSCSACPIWSVGDELGSFADFAC